MAEALAAFVRGKGDAEEIQDGAWYVANALVNIEFIAGQLGKKDIELPPPPEGEE